MRENTKSRTINILIYIFLIILAVIYLLPRLWMLLVSFKTNEEIFRSPFGMPEVVQLGNYIFAW
ncbi:MAG: carbohydrate ABC transporter permease, partial [Lachnospiraceae bacterium]|nr:carbohydrate ABC transporter permease [Lachnospiraceae bacterium]